ncbi:hypothetical protein COM31_23290 [Bacillus toyonensis]|nr:hypothetical protein COM31_23290 [Bacillus toyonensis]
MGYTYWRDRPMMSPLGGFFIQDRNNNNFEVVIPWPEGGLAHFWRDNRNKKFQWHGPTIFGTGEYTGATVIESDFRAYNNSLGNLEVLATRIDGNVEHYWRENGGQFLWKGPFKIFDSARGNPSMAYSGALEKLPINPPGLYRGSYFYVVVPNSTTGFQYWKRSNYAPDSLNAIKWIKQTGAGSVRFEGMALAITTIGSLTYYAGYNITGPNGQIIVAGVSEHGRLHLFVNDSRDYDGRQWNEEGILGLDKFPELNGEFFGRPCLLQGDYRFDELSDWAPFDKSHYGNLELVVPSNRGGILHFWRDCGEPMYPPEQIDKGWRGPIRISGDLYDEVSLIQSSFSASEHGNLEMVARKRNMRGFDFFWRDEKLIWHGPISIIK